MVKTKEVVREVREYEHSFYCDECGKHLGTSKEHSDGWYEEFGGLELKIYINGWYRLNKCLCDECRYKFLEKFKTDLFDLGFKKDE